METHSIVDKYPQGSFTLLKSSTLPLTRQIAIEHQALEPSPTERDLRPLRIKELHDKAEAGILVNFFWAKAKLEGRWLRMNGQHSSTMLANLNGEFPEGLFVFMDEYEVDTPAGLALLFRQFDDRKGARNASDVAGAYQCLVEILRPIPKSTAKLGIDGIAWYLHMSEGLPIPPGDDKYRMFHREAYHEFLVWLGDLFDIKTPELRRQTIVAAIYATYLAGNTEDVRRFWDQVARGGLEYEDSAPSTVLDNWLKWLKAPKEEMAKEKIKPSQIFQGCIYAWNAFREEKQIKEVKYDIRKGFATPKP